MITESSGRPVQTSAKRESSRSSAVSAGRSTSLRVGNSETDRPCRSIAARVWAQDAPGSPVDAREEFRTIALHPDQVVPAVGGRAENDVVLAQDGEGLGRDRCRQIGDIGADGHRPLCATAKGGRERLPQPDAEIAGGLGGIGEIAPQPGADVPLRRPR